MALYNWNILDSGANLKLMSETLKISPLSAAVLANRGIRSKSEAVKYLNPVLSYMNDAGTMKDVEKAARVIEKAIQKNIKTVIYGDYDVDGVMSSVILYKTLVKFGADVSYYIPHREEEGYGLNVSAVEKICADGCKLIITCDNGISAHREISRAKELGAAVIVIDHHEPAFIELDGGKRVDKTPDAAAVVDPKQSDCGYPFKELCAAGICYKFSEYLHKRANADFTDRDEFLILASVATLCDIVSLTGENRIIAKNGLKFINDGVSAGKNIGLAALFAERRIDGKKVTAFDIGFVIGPCINASGRLDHAKYAVELFTTDKPETARSLAASLARLNEGRKTMTANAFELAMKRLSELETAEKRDKVIVMFMPETHESIIGIVAGRIKDASNRPVVMITKSGDYAKGSARSVKAYNMFEGLYKCRDLFVRFGGHAMAAGLTMEEDDIDELRRRLNDDCGLTEADFEPSMDIDAKAELEDVTYGLAAELALFEPFGKDNAAPVFYSVGVLTDQIEIIGDNRKTLRFTFGVDGVRKIKGICFNGADQFVAGLKKTYSEKICDGFLAGEIKRLAVKLDLAYNIEINEYNGSSSVQMKIIDFKFYDSRRS